MFILDDYYFDYTDETLDDDYYLYYTEYDISDETLDETLDNTENYCCIITKYIIEIFTNFFMSYKKN